MTSSHQRRVDVGRDRLRDRLAGRWPVELYAPEAARIVATFDE
jgi:hypothetical protein